MIQTKEELQFYLFEDAKMAKWPIKMSFASFLGGVLFPNHNRRYLSSLRKAEYYNNNRNSLLNRILLYWYLMKIDRLRGKTGIDIGLNIVGPGICLPHGHVVVNMNAKIESHCKILPFVTIGWLGRTDMPKAVPQIGNRVFIGTGAKIIGNVKIADGVVIGANTVVTKSIMEPNTTWVGNPARKIADTGSELYL